MFKIAVLASTNGTTLQAIIDELKADKMPGIELVGVFSNKQCYAIERAAAQGYFTHISATEPEIITALDKQKPDLIVLVGYMRVLSDEFLAKFPKVINVHPSLIPKYCGKNFYGQSVHEAVLANNEKETGMTIHFVDQGVDTGQIILQKTCPVYPNDTAETLKSRVQELEKHWYPEVIRQLASSSLSS
ncbi:phosphoribosylglycinamide formyltransferase [Candidatus Gracilibacteria bacterium]|nr:phosphoribosylglycinamide formyltransferase [Candidatus Gracilibacteria bacterium]